QAEDGIRDRNVTGVQTCALPIFDPILGIDAAVNRATLDGKNPDGWFPEQRITVAEAVRAYTLENAYAAFMEAKTGSITPGKYAEIGRASCRERVERGGGGVA